MSSDLSHSVRLPANRPCSLLVPHVRLRDTHGWIGTAPGCLACEEWFGSDYWRPAGGSNRPEPSGAVHELRQQWFGDDYWRKP